MPCRSASTHLDVHEVVDVGVPDLSELGAQLLAHGLQKLLDGVALAHRHPPPAHARACKVLKALLIGGAPSLTVQGGYGKPKEQSRLPCKLVKGRTGR